MTDPETGDEEGLPASIQEAMAHGMAIVSTRHSGIAEAVGQGVMGLLVEERNTAEHGAGHAPHCLARRRVFAIRRSSQDQGRAALFLAGRTIETVAPPEGSGSATMTLGRAAIQ